MSDDGASPHDEDVTASATLEARVAEALGTPVTASAELGGGEVGRVYRVTLEDGRIAPGNRRVAPEDRRTVVAKTSDTPLDVEAFMLRFLDDRGLPVPEVYHRSEDLLVMEYVEGDGAFTSAAERDVARHLAELHEESPEVAQTDGKSKGSFGFPRDTLSGPYRQPNPWTDSWVEFYRDHRLRFVAERAREERLLPSDLFDRLALLASDLESWLSESPSSSLVHGDVWANNVVVADGEVRAFLDPACYFGHAEVELAYVDFVGFGDAFFETYEAERGIDAGYFAGRREVYQLYPLLEHLRYFEDDRYAAEVSDVLGELGY